MTLPTEARGAFTRILLVEDDLALVRGLKEALESDGCVVRAVNRGNAALETALEFRPDLVILDVMMPGMDGWQVLGALRKDTATASIPVIMLTAADSDDSKIKGFTLGADDYVTKPFSVAELRCRIDAVLRRSQPGEQDASPSIPVIGSGSTTELVRVKDIYYVEGIHNFTYVHTVCDRMLSRLTLGALDEKGFDRLMRVHRSFIVNLDHVKSCGWVSRSSYRLNLADQAGSEVPVSRPLIAEVQKRLGLKD